jgi:hypothetical protein
MRELNQWIFWAEEPEPNGANDHSLPDRLRLSSRLEKLNRITVGIF